MQHLANGHADGTYERRLASYVRPDLLIIDDFGLKPLRLPAPEVFYDAVNERYEHGATLVDSNRALEEWPQLFGDPPLASAGLDRLFHNAHALVITGPSFPAHTRRGELSAAPPASGPGPPRGAGQALRPLVLGQEVMPPIQPP